MARQLDDDCIIKIVMLGASGVGKTSLLAAMYPLLEHKFTGGNYTDYEFIPEDNAKEVLVGLTGTLKKLGEGGLAVDEKSIEGSSQPQEFNFDLRHKVSKEVDIRLNVWDVPGAYFTDDGGSNAVELLKEADITFLCLDCVAMMKDAETNNKTNCIDNVIRCLKDAKISDTCTLVITLMRAEEWEQDGKARDLFDKFLDTFSRPLIKICRDRRIGRVFYTAVQTTGNLRQNGGYNKDGKPQFMRHQQLSYAPKNCELPVFCAVVQSMNTVIEQSLQTLAKLRNVPFVPYFPLLPQFWKYRKVRKRIKRLRYNLPQFEKDLEKLKAKDGSDAESENRLFEW
jgi:hypothetical protein